jgi:O-antigen/teichoic acid export membrane protein
VVQKVQAGYQESYVASLWQAVAAALSLVLVVGMVRLQAGLPWIVLGLVGAVPLAALLNAAWFFMIQRPSLVPRIAEANVATGKVLLRAGSLFLILQLSVAVAYQTDSIVVAQILGAEHVSEYAVPMTLFQISPLLLGLVLTPLWPAYAESLASGDVAWVRRSFRRSLVLALSVNVPAAVLLMVYGASIIRLWVGATARPSALMLISLGMWTMVNSVNGPFAMLLNGIGALRFQAVCAASMAGANLVLSIWLTRMVGASGVVLGTVISQVVFIVIPSAIFIPRALAGMQRARPGIVS